MLLEGQWRLEYAHRVKHYMKLNGFTQKVLAEKTGISTTTINKYLNAKTTPGAYNTAKIAKALSCLPSDLIGS